jgi:hypothetical protein
MMWSAVPPWAIDMATSLDDDSVVIVLLDTNMRMSPGEMPAQSAGPPGTTSATGNPMPRCNCLNLMPRPALGGAAGLKICMVEALSSFGVI